MRFFMPWLSDALRDHAVSRRSALRGFGYTMQGTVHPNVLSARRFTLRP